MNAFRQSVRRHRFFAHAFLALQLVVWLEAPQALEAQELRQEREQRVWQATVRAIGLPEDFGRAEKDEERTLAELASSVATSVDAQIRRLAAKLEPSPDDSALVTPPNAAVGEAGSPESVEARLAKLRPTKPRPVLRRSAAPPRAVGAIDEDALTAGDAVTTRAPGLRAPHALDESFTKQRSTDLSSLAAALPSHIFGRKARTIDSGQVAAPDASLSAVAQSAATRRRPVEVVTKSVDPTIDALAASLNDSPGEIFTFVHDSIDYDPKWGADSPPIGTLWERRGTSWDQAWLLQELLIAAGVDARLEWGTIQIDTPLLLEITGIDDPVRAGDFLATAGLDVLLLVEGSEVTAARFPHVWVKAHLDYLPNRGAGTFVTGTADTWIRMDPSLKTFERVDGTRLDQDVPFDLGQHLASATPRSPREDYETAIAQHISDVGLGITLEEAKTQRTLRADKFPYVPGTLRGDIVSIASEAEAIPASHQVRLDLEVQSADGSPLVEWSTPLPAVYGTIFELRWPGATTADQSTLDLYGGDVYSAPPYEVDLRPSIRLEGVEVATGGSIGAAEDAALLVTATPPAGLDGLDGAGGDGIPVIGGWGLLAGEHAALQVDLGHTPQELVDAQLLAAADAANADPVDPRAVETASLAAAASTYLRSVADDLSHLACLRWQRPLHLGTIALAVQRGAVSTTPDGTPQTFARAPLALEIGARQLALMPVDGVTVSTVPTLELLGSQASVREGEALASVFGGDHVTAVGFLKQAVIEGQTLTRIDASNVAEALASATLAADAEDSIARAVEDGAIAWISETQLDINGWRTTGYVIEDPATGAGGYFVTYERYVRPLEDSAIIFHAPLDLDVVTAPTDVIATIDASGIESWTLSTRPVGSDATTVIASGPGPVDETYLGQFDPTLLLNGLHDLVLTGTTSAGQTISGKITLAVEGNMKIGHFTLSFVDLAIPLSGLDIEIIRTYDSRQRLEQGDFGYGWTLDIRQGSYKNNRPPGDGWQILPTAGPWGLPCQQITETKSHVTTVRLSDREVYRFRQRLTRPVISVGGCFATAVFDFVDGPLPGTTLEVVGNDEVFFPNGNDFVQDVDSLEIFEPTDVKLTTRDGRIFILDLEEGVTDLENPNGNTLEITPDGITHSSGVGVDFGRDAQGRITTITDPAGNDLVYAYDAAGDLVSTKDQLSHETTFAYNSEHYLADVIDARGVRAIRSDYDNEGRLTSITDPLGHSLRLEHQIGSRREVINNRLGFAQIFEYDERGNVVHEIDELGRTTARAYDSDDNLLRVTDPLGQTTTNTYTNRNDLSSTTNALGESVLYTYDERGNPTSITDPRGFVTTLAFDQLNNLTSVHDALGHSIVLTYDTRGNLSSQTDKRGQTTSFGYDANGRVTSETDTMGSVTRFEYDSNGYLTARAAERTLADGSTESVVTAFVVDDIGRLTSTILPDGSMTHTLYDPLGAVLESTDAEGRRTLYSYDDAGQRTTTTYPDGIRETFQYDADGQLVAAVDRGGRTTAYYYDAAGQLVEQVYPDGATTAIGYDSAGRVITVTDPRGHTTEYAYDAIGRTVATTDAIGQTTRRSYDPAGNLTQTVDPLGHTISHVYDEVGRLVRTTLPDGFDVLREYDASGHQIARIDQLDRRTEMQYDSLGRLTHIVDAIGNTTQYTYDELGNLISQTDANGHTTIFGYDSLGRQVSRTLPDGATETTTFDRVGNPTRHTQFDGTEVTFEYDSLDRLISRTAADDSWAQYTYTSSGQRASALGSTGLTQYQYDSRDRLVSIDSVSGWTLRFSWDENGNQTSRTIDFNMAASSLGGPFVTSYDFDPLDRIESIVDDQGGTYRYKYDPANRLEEVLYANGNSTRYSYDSVGRVNSIRTEATDQTVIQDYAYEIGPSGQYTSVLEQSGRQVEWTYDDLDRLINERALNSDGSRDYMTSFSYDPVGNRLEQVHTTGDSSPEIIGYTYDIRDRLQSKDSSLSGVTSFGWDVNGRQVSMVDPSTTTTFEWDAANRLRRVVGGDGDATFLYDVDGNRVSTRTTATDGTSSDSLHLTDPTGALPDLIAEVQDNSEVARLVRGYQPLAQLSSSGTHFLHGDHLGSIRAVSDELGELSDHTSYTAFGEGGAVAGLPISLAFAGEPRITIPQAEPLELTFLRARWIQPSIGRFASPDPFRGFLDRPDSLHPYQYASNNPVNRLDPSGNFSISISGALTGLGVASLVFSVVQFALEPTLGNAVMVGIDVALLPISWAKLMKAGKYSTKIGNIIRGSRVTGLTRGEEIVRAAYEAKGWKLLMAGKVLIKELYHGKQGKKAVDFIHVANQKLHLTEVTTKLRTDEVAEAIIKFEDTTRAVLEFAKRGGASLDEIGSYRLVVEQINPSQLRQGYTIIGGELWQHGSPVLVNGRRIVLETLEALRF